MTVRSAADLPVTIRDLSAVTTDRAALARLGKERPCEIEIDTLVAAFATLVEGLGVDAVSVLAVVDCFTAVLELETGTRIQLELVTDVDSVDSEVVERLEPLLCENAELLVVTDSPVTSDLERLCDSRSDLGYTRIPVGRRPQQ